MTQFLLRHFVRDYQNTDSDQVRTRYGVLAGVVGIVINILLFAIKLFGGMVSGSLSMKADAVNSLSDACSQGMALVGIKMSERPADADHPFGHGRYEYLTALLVAFIILHVGVGFVKSSIERIVHPQGIDFHFAVLLLLGVSMLFKIWLALFNRQLGKKIDSGVMTATAADAFGDVLCTGVVALGMILDGKFGIRIDGYAGLAVAAMVLLAGVGVLKDTLEPLIGAAADPELAEKIRDQVESYEGIIGTHDLIVHSYGPTKHMATIHAEVSNKADIEDSHELIDRIEMEVKKTLGVFLVIHMDPVEMENKKVLKYRKQVGEIISRMDPEATFHDFRIVSGEKRVNVIFDLVVPASYTAEEKENIRCELEAAIRAMDPKAQPVILVEHSFIGEK